jgi:hypothetical protein
MNRIVNVVLVVLMMAGAAATYQMKHRAEQAAQRVARLNANIAKERETIALLKAEWSLLSQPGRLQSVISRYKDHFNLEPFAASQVATLDEIPLKPATSEAATPTAVAEVAAPLR